MLIIVICLSMEKKCLNLKLTKNVNFPTKFCIESIANGFSATEFREVSLNGNGYDFSENDNFIGKSDMLNILKYLMTKHNMK